MMHFPIPTLSLSSSLVWLSLLAFLNFEKAPAAEIGLVEQSPTSVSRPTPKTHFVDFGRVAFGNLRLIPPAGAQGEITVHLGEKLHDGRVDRKPPGSIRYKAVTVTLDGDRPLIVAPEADARNTEQISDKHPPAVLTPPEWGVVLPFRWVEIEDWPGDLNSDQIIRRAAFATSWDDDAADFTSSDPLLDQIWELCRYTIKATTFAGIYVDGDRERIAYEADAYLNQLCQYYTDHDFQMARKTYDWLMQHETWPTEWAAYMVFMAHADWMQTGDTRWLADRYETLKGKTLTERAGQDGLITSYPDQLKQWKKADLVDWPGGERDGYVFTEVNTVVNSCHLAAIQRMAELARALGKVEEAEEFEARFRNTYETFQQRLFDPARGIYRDGVGTDHASQHANFFPLAFGLVPEENRRSVVDWLKPQEMRCSVFAAQYLLEALFQNDADEAAIALTTAPTDRSWRHMVENDASMTWEAWDRKYKSNLDWNHPWGAGPANLFPRFLLGVQTLEPGWRRVLIRPSLGGLTHAKGKIPTPRGPILIDWTKDSTFRIAITLPEGTPARVELPALKGTRSIYVNGTPAQAHRQHSRWLLQDEVSGSVVIEMK